VLQFVVIKGLGSEGGGERAARRVGEGKQGGLRQGAIAAKLA